jgi:hypothetical protein
MTKYTMFMEDKENTNRTPRKMARIAWPKAKYGVILAIIIIIIVNTIFYWETITSFFK